MKEKSPTVLCFAKDFLNQSIYLRGMSSIQYRSSGLVFQKTHQADKVFRAYKYTRTNFYLSLPWPQIQAFVHIAGLLFRELLALSK